MALIIEGNTEENGKIYRLKRGKHLTGRGGRMNEQEIREGIWRHLKRNVKYQFERNTTFPKKELVKKSA